jgi:hypothetical protein
MNDDHKAYADAFNEDHQAQPEPSEDEAFGLANPASPEEVKAEDGSDGQSSDPAEVAIVIDGGDLEKQAEDAQAKQTAEEASEAHGQDNPAEEQAEGEGDASEVQAPQADMEKEVQRLKSWEGRLKAMEARLKAAGATTPEEEKEAVGEAIEKAAESLPNEAAEDQVEQMAEQVENGSISPEQAMKQLAEDFGDDFVKMIEAIAVAKAKEAGGNAANEKFGQLSQTVDSVINDIVDTKAKAHFEQIAQAHPDFQEVGGSEQFKAYVEALPEGEKEQAMQTIANGSAKQINALLSAFKSQVPAAKEDQLTEAQGETVVDEAVSEDPALDAAEGVRSTGMKLPDEPKAQGDYAGAWDDF